MERQMERNNATRFFVVQEFMTKTLNLKGNELLIYAIIYGFSQDEETAYTGTLSYLSSWTNTTKQGVLKNLKSLIEKGLIIKKEFYKNKIKYCEYRATLFTPSQQSLPPQSTQFNGGGKLSLPNNINDSINNNISIIDRDDKESRLDAQARFFELYPEVIVDNYDAARLSSLTAEDWEKIIQQFNGSAWLRDKVRTLSKLCKMATRIIAGEFAPFDSASEEERKRREKEFDDL